MTTLPVNAPIVGVSAPTTHFTLAAVVQDEEYRALDEAAQELASGELFNSA